MIELLIAAAAGGVVYLLLKPPKGRRKSSAADNAIPGKMQESDIKKLVRLIKKKKFNPDPDDNTPQGVPEEMVQRLVDKILKMDLPIFKIARKRLDDAKKLVPVKKFRHKVRQVPKLIHGVQKIRQIITTREPSQAIEDDYEIRPMRSFGEVSKIMSRKMLGLPRHIFAKKAITGEVPVREYQAEVKHVSERSVPTKETIIIDEPYTEEYIEMMEVVTEPRSQLLYFLIDGSGSMEGWKAIIAIALAVSVVRYGMDNKSKFYYRQFSGRPGRRHEAETTNEKERLVSRIIGSTYNGGNTNITDAISAAAEDIKSEHRKVDQAEILLITDGDDTEVYGERVRQCLGEDVILHTVVVGDYDNGHLRVNSSTYLRLPANFGIS